MAAGGNRRVNSRAGRFAPTRVGGTALEYPPYPKPERLYFSRLLWDYKNQKDYNDSTFSRLLVDFGRLLTDFGRLLVVFWSPFGRLWSLNGHLGEDLGRLCTPLAAQGPNNPSHLLLLRAKNRP